MGQSWDESNRSRKKQKKKGKDETLEYMFYWQVYMCTQYVMTILNIISGPSHYGWPNSSQLVPFSLSCRLVCDSLTEFS